MKRKTITIPNLYSEPPLYDVLYNRTKSYKLGEAAAFSCVLEQHPSPVRSIIELFSGETSHHRNFFQDAYFKWPAVTKYKCLDSYAPAGHRVVNAEAHDPWNEKFDAALAYFCTSSSIIDMENHGRVTRSYTTRVFHNVLNHLNRNGVFVLEASGNGGLGTSLNCALEQQPDKKGSAIYRGHYPLYPGHTIHRTLSKYGFKNTQAQEVSVDTLVRTVYNRTNSNVEDFFEHIVVNIGTSDQLTIKVNLPFCQRYFSEQELTDMLLEAGARKIDYWNMDYPLEQFQRLSNTVDLRDRPRPEFMSENEIEAHALELSANLLVIHK